MVSGYLLDKQKFKDKYVTNEEKEDGLYFDITNELKECGVDTDEKELFVLIDPHPCCSDISDKYLFVGKKLKTINRMYTDRYNNDLSFNKSCKDCGENTLCNKCINSTIDGEYPVYNIYNNAYKINANNVCNNCLHYFYKDEEKCPICYCPNRLTDFDYKLNIDKELVIQYGIFLFLDDCTSCT